MVLRTIAIPIGYDQDSGLWLESDRPIKLFRQHRHKYIGMTRYIKLDPVAIDRLYRYWMQQYSKGYINRVVSEDVIEFQTAWFFHIEEDWDFIERR